MTGLTRKHFERIAEILGSHKSDVELETEFATWLGETNPLFNTSRFYNRIAEVRKLKKAEEVI